MEVENKQKSECNNENDTKNYNNNVQPEALFEKAYELASKVAATGLGQFAIEKIDNVLYALEKTAKWSLPQTENTDKGTTSSTSLERPLPWLPFLATIVTLRAVRLSVSFASVLIGNNPVTPSDFVYFLQTRRRKLRAIKYHGLRAIRIKKQSNLDRQRRGVIGKLGSIFGSVVCRTGYRGDSPTRVVVKKKKSKNSKNQKSMLNANKIQENKLLKKNEIENESDDDELTCDQMLEKYAGVSDDEDSDFSLDENFSENSDETSEGADDEDQISEIEKRLIELNRKRDEEDLEKKKELIDQLIQQKKDQIENDIRTKLESQIEERIEKHTQALKAKFDEKIEEIQSGNDTNLSSSPPVLDNPTSVSINPAKLSPKIAHNGNSEENKIEKHEKLQNDVTEINKGNENYLIDEISINLKLRSIKGNEIETQQISAGSSSEDLFYSPIASPSPDNNFENHAAPLKDIIKQKETINAIESTAPFIENEVKTQLQINLKQANNTKKANTINTYKNIKPRN